MMPHNNYILSVIVPMYNAESTISRTITSVLNQTIGMDNIQLILVDDGSIDGTGNVCEEYIKKYPKNVFYHKKENGGVSSSRNYGLKRATGKYLTFLDSDDWWEESAFENALSFWKEQDEKNFDVLFCRILIYQEGEIIEHSLDYRFEQNKVVDLLTDYENMQMTIGNAIFRRDALTDVQFDTNMQFAEDAFFVASVVMKKSKCGICNDAVYYYRKDISGSSASGNQRFQRSYYNKTPYQFHLRLIQISINQMNKVPKYVQNILLYDLRWRIAKVGIDQVLSDSEKGCYRKTIQNILQYIEDPLIAKGKGMNRAKKLFLLDLKYDKDILDEATITGKGMIKAKGVSIFNAISPPRCKVSILEIHENLIHLEGRTDIWTVGNHLQMYIENDKAESKLLALEPYPDGDQYAFTGDRTVINAKFSLLLPVYDGAEYRFYMRFNNEENRYYCKIRFESDVLLDENLRMSYYVSNSYIIRYYNRRIHIQKATTAKRLYRRYRLVQELKQSDNIDYYHKYRTEVKLIQSVDHARLKHRIAFATARSDENLLANIRAVYDQVVAPKVTFTHMTPYSDAVFQEAADKVYHSKVVVTDDYFYPFRKFGKKPGQKFVQVWHAAGAFKKFGQDGTNMFPPVDQLYHRDYDLVTVSSEYVRPIYAKAFGIPVERVEALGVPRTDRLLDRTWREETREKIFTRYSEFREKRILLYAPTFRGNGQKRKYFVPDIDFDSLQEHLREDQIFVFCPHPVMRNQLIGKDYGNIIQIEDFSTNEMMCAADLLITDYSSVIFEFSLFDKPMLFYCYDYGAYDRDFYLDYETELPGRLIREYGELEAYLEKGEFGEDDPEYAENLRKFRERYMSACDGHSAERIAKRVEAMLRE